MKGNLAVYTKNPLKWLYAAGLFAIVGLIAINLPPWFSPPAWGNTIFFKLILGGLLLVALWKWLWSSRLSPGPSAPLRPGLSKPARWVLCALGALIGIFFLASLFGLDRTFSFWGDPNRSWGFINYLFYGLFALVLFWILREEKQWRLFWAVFASAGIIVVLIGFFQHLGVFPNLLVEQGRPGSVLGNPLYVSLFVLPFSFLSLVLGLMSKTKKLRVFFFAAALVFFFGVLLTASRSAFIGFGVGVFFFLLFYPKKTLLIKGIGVVVVVAFATLAAVANLMPPPGFVESSRATSLLWSRLSFETALREGRVDGWNIVGKGVLDRPFFGYGMYNVSIPFDRYYNPTEHQYIHASSEGSSWDSSHNLFIDVAAWAGIPGLLVFLTFLGTIFAALVRLRRNALSLTKADTSNALLAHGVMTAFIAYLVHAFFMFDTFATYLLFFSFVGYTLYLSNQESQFPKPGSEKVASSALARKLRKYKLPVFVGALLLFAVFAWQYNIKPFLVNAEIQTAKIQGAEQCETALSWMKKAIERGSTHLDNYLRIQYANQLSQCERKVPEKSLHFTLRKYELLEEAALLRPTFTRAWIGIGSAASVLAKQAEGGAVADATQEHIDFFKQRAQEAFQRAQELSPNRQQIYQEWAKANLLAEQYGQVREKAQQCVALAPASGICWWYIVLGDIGTGNKERAQAALAKAEASGFEINLADARHQLIEAYLNMEDYAEIKTILLELITEYPANSQYRIALLVAHMELREYAQAREVAQDIQERFPERVQEAAAILQTRSR
ncbi:MAG: O-antigen ligase family protein [Candidatus Yanofskybacteria bacterium]|nr:O-antigen ligase family protein [Candidatus Yanofskybacteria bacterium]